MWNDYYDEVIYEEKEEKLDKTGNIKYKEPSKLKVRLVGGASQLLINTNGTSTKYSKEYQVPQVIKEGDKIDGRLVVNVHPVKDLFGLFHYCIVKVE